MYVFVFFGRLAAIYVSIDILHSDKSEQIFKTGETNVRRYYQEIFA